MILFKKKIINGKPVLFAVGTRTTAKAYDDNRKKKDKEQVAICKI